MKRRLSESGHEESAQAGDRERHDGSLPGYAFRLVYDRAARPPEPERFSSTQGTGVLIK